MKIYARNMDPDHLIASQVRKYVGKDVWVKVSIDYLGRESFIYAKFLNIYKHSDTGEFMINLYALTFSDVVRMMHGHQTYANLIYNYVSDPLTYRIYKTYPEHWILKIYPDVYTTIELLDMAREVKDT